jgi:hypothetical protein
MGAMVRNYGQETAGEIKNKGTANMNKDKGERLNG